MITLRKNQDDEPRSIPEDDVIREKAISSSLEDFTYWYCKILGGGGNAQIGHAHEKWAGFRGEYHDNIADKLNLKNSIISLRKHMNKIYEIVSFLRSYTTGFGHEITKIGFIEEVIGKIIDNENNFRPITTSGLFPMDYGEVNAEMNLYYGVIQVIMKYRPDPKITSTEPYPIIARKILNESKNTVNILKNFNRRSKYIFYNYINNELFLNADFDYSPAREQIKKIAKESKILQNNFNILTITKFRTRVIIHKKMQRSVYEYMCDDNRTPAVVFGELIEQIFISVTTRNLAQSYNDNLHLEKTWDSREKKNMKWTVLKSSKASDRYTIKGMLQVKNFQWEGVNQKNRKTIEIYKGIVHPITKQVIIINFNAEEKYANSEFYKNYELLEKYIQFF